MALGRPSLGPSWGCGHLDHTTQLSLKLSVLIRPCLVGFGHPTKEMFWPYKTIHNPNIKQTIDKVYEIGKRIRILCCSAYETIMGQPPLPKSTPKLMPPTSLWYT